MKVVIPVVALERSGGCKSLVDIANAMHARGHDTEIVLPYSAPVSFEVDCKVTYIPTLSKELIPYGDIVLTNFYLTFLPAYEAWPDQCVRFCQGYEPHWAQDRQLAEWTYTCGVPVISTSGWIDDELFRLTGKRSAAVIPLGINPGVFYPPPRNRRSDLLHKLISARKDPYLDSPVKRILYIARDPGVGYKMKGFEDFRDSMEILMRIFDGDLLVQMVCVENILLELPRIPCRNFGPVTPPEMADLYRSSDLFVSTSWSEGFGLPPLEAMACGTPVVTTNSGGVTAFAEHQRNAFVVEARQPEAIARGMRELLADNGLANKLAREGIKTAAKFTEDRFKWSMIDALESIHRSRRMKSKPGRQGS